MDPTTAQHIREAFYAALCFVFFVGLWFYLGHRSEDHGPTRWAKWKAFLTARYVGRPSVMSRAALDRTPDRPVAPPVVLDYEEARQLIATTDNEDNDELSEQRPLPEEVRDIIRFHAQVEGLATLYNLGQISNLAKAIEGTFRCSRSSKEDSTYQKVKRALDPLIAKQPEPTPIAGRPTAAQFASDREAA